MITTAKRLGALLSACLLLWSASISALADEAGMPESEAPPEETQQEDAALSDRDFYLEDSEVATYAAANQQGRYLQSAFLLPEILRNHHDFRHIGRTARKSNGHKFRLLSGVLLG